ncbi:hypothetical protein D3C75_667710 [compost metagenome]
MYGHFICFYIDNVHLIYRIFELVGCVLFLDLRTDLSQRGFGINEAHESVIVLFIGIGYIRFEEVSNFSGVNRALEAGDLNGSGSSIPDYVVACCFTYKPDRYISDVINHFGSGLQRFDDSVNARIFAADLQLDGQAILGGGYRACLGVKYQIQAQLLKDRPHWNEDRVPVIQGGICRQVKLLLVNLD